VDEVGVQKNLSVEKIIGVLVKQNESHGRELDASDKAGKVIWKAP